MELETLIEDSLDVLRAIEETLAANDPYNNVVYSSDYAPTIEDCEFPDHIEDPLLLLRVVLGDECARRIESTSDLELIAHALEECIARSRKEAAAQGAKPNHCQEVQG